MIRDPILLLRMLLRQVVEKDDSTVSMLISWFWCLHCGLYKRIPCFQETHTEVIMTKMSITFTIYSRIRKKIRWVRKQEGEGGEMLTFGKLSRRVIGNFLHYFCDFPVKSKIGFSLRICWNFCNYTSVPLLLSPLPPDISPNNPLQ
jgi:hypothetical protein